MDRLDLKRLQVLEVLGDSQGLGRQGGLVAGRVMTLAPSCISPQTTALELIQLFHRKQFRHLLVTGEEDRLIGVISDRDVIGYLGPNRLAARSALSRVTAAEIMSTDLVTVGPDTPLEQAVRLMIEQGISCLPVLTGGKLVGILTNTDLHLVLQVLLQTVRQSSLEESIALAISDPQD